MIPTGTTTAAVNVLNDEARLENDLRARAARLANTGADGHVRKLKGDASNRSYYRVAGNGSSVVAMVMPTTAKASEEATNGAPPAELPFLNVQRYLDSLGLRVPRIYEYDEPAGILFLEDLGDVTFESALPSKTTPPSESDDRSADFEALYVRAVELLARMRVTADASRDPDCIAFGRSFDRGLYRWELEHFHEWGLVARSGKEPTDAERAVLDGFYDRIADALDVLPRGFTHRDYQSRNLMVKDGELVVIDFQDALLGPVQYDLVALLRDSYVELDRALVERLVERYCDAYEREGGDAGDRREFLRVFDLLTVQRKLKDGGRFIFIDRVKGNPSFLPSVPASFRYVKDAIARLPELAPMGEILARYVPELA